MQYVRTVNRKVSKICLQMGLLNEDIAFHSSIPAPLDITVAVVYSVFGELNLVYNTINEFSLSSAQAEMNSSMKQGILQRSLASTLLFLTVTVCYAFHFHLYIPTPTVYSSICIYCLYHRCHTWCVCFFYIYRTSDFVSINEDTLHLIF